MKICIMTYDAPHLKTADVSMNLFMRGFKEIDFMVVPFKKHGDRVVAFNHRPQQFEGVDVRSLAGFFGSKVLNYGDWKEFIDSYDYFLICGAGLIDGDFANSGKVINCHPGLIPTARGLDSFKWSILRNSPVGNTLHYIDSGVDSGKLILRDVTPVFLEDDIRTFADRHYKREIFLLSHFDNLLKRSSKINFDLSEVSEPTKRMNVETEAQMLRSFEDYKNTHALGGIRHS